MQVLIIGAGEVGFHLAQRLSREDHGVVVVDRDPARLREVVEQMDVQTVLGVGSSPDTLRSAEAERADMVVAVTNSDEVNMVACLVARELAPAAARVARIRQEDYLDLPGLFAKDKLDVETVINPEREVTAKIRQFLAVPAAASVTDFADGRVKMLGLRIPPYCEQVGCTLMELRPGAGPDFLVAAIERDGQVIIPRGEDKILAGDLAFVMVRDTAVEAALRQFGLRSEPVRNLVVIGGGVIGRHVAQDARAMGIKTRVIEKDPQRCRDLAAKLDGVMVLQGDGTDLSLLREENVGAADVFAAVTGHEEDNALIALLGRKMGARRTIARVSHMGYVPLVGSLGLDLVVSPRFAAVGAILRLLRRGKVLAVSSLSDEGPELIEVEALETSQLVGRPLAKVNIPRGALVASLIRDEEVEIPSGDTVIQPGDRLVIFLLPEALRKVEELLTVRLEYF